MLDLIRSSAQSFGVKLAFGLIILVFVFWGVGNFNDRDYTNVVAVVNGRPILAIEFEKAYQNAEESIMRSNPGMTRERLAKDHLGREVLRELIQRALIMQEAERGGVRVGPEELLRHVSQIKAFQDESGRFSPEIYKRMLEARRTSPASFESDLRDQLTQEKMFGLVTAHAWADPDETRERYNFLRQKRLVDYLFFPASDFIAEVSPSGEEASKWYEEHKADFTLPASVDISYISINPADLINKNEIPLEKLQAWHDANKARFENKEMVKASHILVSFPPDADEAVKKEARDKIEAIKKEIEAGKSFAKAADEHNQPGAAGKGGDLGWIERGQTVPQFEEAVFAAQPGELGGAVETPYGLHLILVDEKRSAGVKALEEVIDEVRGAVAFEEGADRLHDALDALVEDNILQKPQEESAARYGLKVQKAEGLSKDQLQEKLGISAQDAEAVMASPQGAPLDTALAAGDSYLVARVTGSRPESVRPFSEVKERVEKELKEREALKLAAGRAESVLKDLRGKPAAEWGAAAKGLKSKISVERRGPVADFGVDPSLSEDIFSTEPQNWLSEPHLAHSPEGDGAALFFVESVEEPPADEFNKVEPVLREAALQDRKEALYSIFLQRLADGAKIEITNQNIIDRVGR